VPNSDAKERGSLDAIENLISKYRLSRMIYESNGSNYQEAETRSEFIDPLLRCLGWDVENEAGVIFYEREVLREESQQTSGTTKKPDYTIKIAGKTRMFVEAKKPSIDITTSQTAIFQARSYGYTAGHPIVILTNFRHLSIYECTTLPNETDPPDASLIFQCSYGDYVSKIDEIRNYLERGSVASDTWYEQFANFEYTSELPVSKTLFQRVANWKLIIAQDVIANNHIIDESSLDIIAQKLINRLLFVRVCEDRGIEGEKFLAKAIQTTTFDVQTFFNQLDARYNSGLFDQTHSASEPSIHVSSNVIRTIVDQLYQPYSPFSFSILGSDLLGIAYELALTEQIKIEVSGNQKSVSLERRKEYFHRDVVTTPQSLVEITVAEALEALGSFNVESLKVLDFAIGSGRFLIALYKETMKKLLFKEIVSGSFGNLEKVGVDQYKLTYQAKCNLLINCFFGIDVDYIACEIAKFSLLITLLEDENPISLHKKRPILPNLDRNIIHGNTLVRPDSSMSQSQILETKPIDFTISGLPASFDLIVGNPPYMKTKDMKNLNSFEYEYLKRKYNFAHKQFDKYMPFVEFSVSHLKSGGVCSVVIPNKWITNVSGSVMREFFESNKNIIRIANYRHIKVFADKDAYIATLTFTNGSFQAFEYTEPNTIPLSNGSQSTFMKVSVSDVHRYSNSCWVLPKDYRERKILDCLISNSIRLADVVTPKNGIQTSLNDVYVITQSEITSISNGLITFSKDGNVFSIEEGILMPFLEDTSKVHSHSVVKSDAYVVYPYSLTVNSQGNPQFSIIDLSTLKSSYPLAFKYLSKMKSRLSARSLSSSLVQPFYAFGRHQNIASAPISPKIFYSTNQLGDKYALDETGIVFESGGTAGEVVLYPNKSGYSLDFVLALLDQTAIEFFIRKRGSPFQGGYYSRGTAVISEVPVPRIDFRDSIQTRWHDEIAMLQKKCRDINMGLPQVHPNQLAQATQELSQLKTQIRDAFLARWELSESDVQALID